MSNPHGLKVGQKLVRVDGHRYGNRPPRIDHVTITKIGRKWAHTSATRQGEKVHLEKLFADGGQYESPAQYYLSLSDYEEKQKCAKLWQRFTRVYSLPAGVTSGTLIKAAAMLGIDLEAMND